MKAKKPEVYASDDYAGLQTADYSFYFGYEHSICLNCGTVCEAGRESCDGVGCEDSDTEWCFFANINGEEITIPESKLGEDRASGLDVVDRLLTGIGWILTGYELKKRL